MVKSNKHNDQLIGYINALGINISERHTFIAFPDEKYIKIVILSYKQRIKPNDTFQIGKRIFDIQQFFEANSQKKSTLSVLSVPDYLTLKQISQIIEYCQIIGLTFSQVISDLSAASLYSLYLIKNDDKTKENLVICFKKIDELLSIGFSIEDSNVCDVLSHHNYQSPQHVIDFFVNQQDNKQDTHSIWSFPSKDRLRLLHKVISFGEHNNKKFYQTVLFPVLSQIADKEQIQFVHDPYYPALGSLIQSAVLVGSIRDILLLNIHPCSYGISITDEQEIFYCQNCWKQVDDSSQKKCLTCNQNLVREIMPIIGKAADKFKIYHILQGNVNIPTLKRTYLYLDKDCSAYIDIHAIENDSKSYPLKKVRFSNSLYNEGFCLITIDIDANQKTICALELLPQHDKIETVLFPCISLEEKKESLLKRIKSNPNTPKIKTKYIKHDLRDFHANSTSPILSEEEIDSILEGLL